MSKARNDDKVICRNKKATHKFEIVEKIECGIILTGSEVKSLRDRGASLDEAYARIDDDELWLIGLHIPLYRHATTTTHDPMRKRKLLVHGRQLHKIEQRVQQKGFALIPLAAYFNERGLAKITLALGRGKSRADKRQALKERDARREIDRAR